MRKSAVLSQVQENLLGFIKRSNDSFRARPAENNRHHPFYRDFNQTNKLKSCEIKGIQIETGSAFSRSYALYVIKVVTVDIEYQVKRRFSDFLNFYLNSQAIMHLNLSFPCKTFLTPGWTQGVTRKRKNQFNQLIRYILEVQHNQEIKFSFYEFIELYAHYEQEGILEFCRAQTVESGTALTDEELIEKIVILSHQPINSLTIIKQINGALLNRKKKINYDIAKQIIVGSHSHEGLLSIVLNSSNQLVILEGLQLLLEFFSPETNRDYQMFLRILSRCQPSQLVLGEVEPVETDSILKICYFQLIYLYLLSRGESALESIAQEYDRGDILHRQYMGWERLRRLEGAI